MRWTSRDQWVPYPEKWSSAEWTYHRFGGRDSSIRWVVELSVSSAFSHLWIVCFSNQHVKQCPVGTITLLSTCTISIGPPNSLTCCGFNFVFLSWLCMWLFHRSVESVEENRGPGSPQPCPGEECGPSGAARAQSRQCSAEQWIDLILGVSKEREILNEMELTNFCLFAYLFYLFELCNSLRGSMICSTSLFFF